MQHPMVRVDFARREVSAAIRFFVKRFCPVQARIDPTELLPILKEFHFEPEMVSRELRQAAKAVRIGIIEKLHHTRSVLGLWRRGRRINNEMRSFQSDRRMPGPWYEPPGGDEKNDKQIDQHPRLARFQSPSEMPSRCGAVQVIMVNPVATPSKQDLAKG